MKITSLMDDYCPDRGYIGQHGLSLILESDDHSVLFDAGQDGQFIHNAQKRCSDLSLLDAVVVSHGHYDHAGGLSALYEHLRPAIPPLYAGCGWQETRCSRKGNSLVDIGVDNKQYSRVLPEPRIIDRLEEIAPRIFVLPKASILDGSEPPARFVRISQDIESRDWFDDELALVLTGKDSISVVTGCAHRGIVNILESAIQHFPGRRLHAVVGGFHLREESASARAAVAQRVAELHPEFVYCSHCTGLEGFAALLAAMPGKVSWLACGAEISI